MSSRKTRWLLCKSLVQKLESDQSIEFKVNNRNTIIDEVDAKIKAGVLADEDVKDFIIAELKSKKDEILGASLSEDEAYLARKQAWLDNNKEKLLHGLYFVTSMRDTSKKIIEYLMTSKHIEEVYADDEALLESLIAATTNFNEEKLY